MRPNEKFSGKGHRIHVRKECARMPKEKREAIEQKDEIFEFLKQFHISDKNVSRLKTLSGLPNPRIAELAGIVLEVALVKPYKKRRLKALARQRRDLVAKRVEQAPRKPASLRGRLGWQRCSRASLGRII